MEEEQDLRQALLNAHQVIQEQSALIAELRQQNQLLLEQITHLQEQNTSLQKQVRDLKQQLKQDSHNSHLPPSSDRFARQPKSLRKPSGKKAGGQSEHPGNTLMPKAEPDQRIEYPLEQCPHCQTNLLQVPILDQQRRQVVELPPQRVLFIEHVTQSKQCPTCLHISQSDFPQQVQAPIQYGASFGALAVYLVEQHLLPLARTAEILHDVTGLSMSVGTICEQISRCSTALQPVEETTKEALRRGTVLHQDESGMYIKGKRHWMHVSCTAKLTHYATHPKRGRKALDAIDILPHFAGTSVHDGWSPYQGYDCEHALCNVHHLRELVGIEEQTGQSWPKALRALLLQMKDEVQRAREQGASSLPRERREALVEQYRLLLEEGDRLNPEKPTTGKKGRPKRSKARNLLNRLFHQDHVLAFLDNFEIPFDNNQAERDIRMLKVQQKISGSFRSDDGAYAFCRIRGYLSTLRKQGLPLLTALEQALTGHPLSPAF